MPFKQFYVDHPSARRGERLELKIVCLNYEMGPWGRHEMIGEKGSSTPFPPYNRRFVCKECGYVETYSETVIARCLGQWFKTAQPTDPASVPLSSETASSLQPPRG